MTYPYIELSLDQAKPLINEGDILLFRGNNLPSRLVKRSSESLYSHVGILSWVNGSKYSSKGILMLLEFRQGSLLMGLLGMHGQGGGRAVNFDIVINHHGGQWDLYRPVNFFSSWHFNPQTNKVELIRKEFVGKLVTREMRKIMGLPYGWRRIWWIAKHKLFLLRLFYKIQDLTHDGVANEIIYPVCSTAIAHVFSKNGFDLIKNRSDEWTEPGHLANSARLSYLFSIKKEN